MADEIEFVDGLIVKKPSDKAPDFVIANLSIKVEDMGKWLREKYKAGDEWVNIDVKEAKSGKWYASVSNYKPKKKDEPQPRQQERQAPQRGRQRPQDTEDDIPF